MMAHPELLRLRESIDNIDAALIRLLAERFQRTRAVTVCSSEQKLPAPGLELDDDKRARLKALAVQAKLDPEFAEKFLGFVAREMNRHREP